MKQLHLLFIISASFLFFSCVNELEFNGEQQQPMLVLNSFVTPDSVVKIQLTRSKFFLEDDTKFDAIVNADVQLFVNGSFVEKLNHSTNGYYTGTYFPKENDILKFVAFAPQLVEINASTTIASKQLITGIDSSTVSLGEGPILQYHSENGGPYITDTMGFSATKGLDLRIRFKDAPNQKNYYRLVLYGKSYSDDGQVLINQINSTSDDLVFGNSSTDILGEISSNYSFNEFNDQLIDGQSYELKTRVYYSFTTYKNNKNPYTSHLVGIRTITKQELVVELQSISESYYHYLKSMTANQGSDDFFSEPAQMYSNITNGLGILGSYTRSSKVFELPVTVSYDIYYNGGF